MEQQQQQAEKKVFNADEIKQLAPGYRGKPENFDVAKVGRKPRTNKKILGPKSPNVVPPLMTNTPQIKGVQRNESLITDAVFGIGVSVAEIAPRQNFDINLSKVPTLCAEIFSNCKPDERQLDRLIAREEMSYYGTALMWLRLLDIKAKQGTTALTSAEKDICRVTAKDTYNVPAPLCIYLNELGPYKDKMGKETQLNVPNLPVAVAQNFGGYHANSITQENHNLFEEVPSLGVAGDMVMALTAEGEEPAVNFHVGVPAHTRVSENLTGRFTPIGPRRQEIRQRLIGMGITPTTFPEFVAGTRFHLRYIRSLSDIIGKLETFRVDKMCFENLTIAGGEAQTIVTQPIEREHGKWTDVSVQPTSASTSSIAFMGASYVFGFQLRKEDGLGATELERMQNWCCIEQIPGQEWINYAGWRENRNARRNLPDGIGTARFRAIAIRQDVHTENVVRCMIKTPR